MRDPSLWQQNAKDRPAFYAAQEMAQQWPTVPTAGFRAYLGSNYTLTATTDALIPFNTLEFDLDGEYHAASGVWVPRFTGVHLVTAGAYLATNQGDGARLSLSLFENGNRIRQFVYVAEGANFAPAISGADLILATAGSSYDVRVTTAVGSSGLTGGTAYTWFGALLLRQFT